MKNRENDMINHMINHTILIHDQPMAECRLSKVMAAAARTSGSLSQSEL